MSFKILYNVKRLYSVNIGTYIKLVTLNKKSNQDKQQTFIKS